MTQLRSIRARLSCDRGEQQLFLLWLFIGSCVGVFSASLHNDFFPKYSLVFVRRVSLFHIWLRCAVFPVLMAVAMLCGRKSLTRLLFFFKGVFVALTVFAFFASGVSSFSSFVPVFLFETMFPLPVILMAGSLWAGQTESGQPELWTLIPVLLWVLIGVLLETILF